MKSFTSLPICILVSIMAMVVDGQSQSDWLIDASSAKASVTKDDTKKQVVLSNGLVERRFYLGENVATIGYENLTNRENLIRAIRPEAKVVICGKEMAVGGLIGQENHAYFAEEDVRRMKADPQAMKYVGYETGAPVAEFAWKRVRHHAPDLAWPPKGVSIRFDYQAPAGVGANAHGRVLWTDEFRSMDTAWSERRSSSVERISFCNEGKAGEIYAPMGKFCYAERAVPDGAAVFEAVIDGGTDLATSWGPGMALVFGDGSVVKSNLRMGDRGRHGHFEMRVAGKESLATVKEFADADGGLSNAQAYRLRARLIEDRVVWDVSREQQQKVWHPLFETKKAMGGVKFVRMGKMDRQGAGSDDAQESAEYGRSTIREVTVREADTSVGDGDLPNRDFIVSVHYEIYDQIPVIVKWLTVENRGKQALRVDRLVTEILAMPEHDNMSQAKDAQFLEAPQGLIVTTDYAFGGVFDYQQTNKHVVHYTEDPLYKTQVNYSMTSPCLLQVSPDRGPAQDVLPGETFRSYRTYELAVEGDRERRSLAYRKSMRVVAPWVTENPLMMHVRSSDPKVVREAIQQCADIGFEMLILSFGSGFNAENDDPKYLAQWKVLVDEAKAKGVEMGVYSLYASRSVGGGNDMVAPKGERLTFGSCPAITSDWGQKYIKKLGKLFDETGFMLFENDGPYPGDVDVTARPPLQKGEQDSQWVHWKIWSQFFRDLRSKGVYLNQPDYYFLNGGSKTGMGYREVNWSLPREQQVIHTRQNIYDGTWERTPSMGWMFVPLTQYQGGGAAATIEPLSEHIDHYERMLQSNLAFGVQACYRGTRLYDSPKVKEMVKKQVDWFKANREILESDVIHVRRATGRALDGVLHVNPGKSTPAMLCVFNPTDKELVETWSVPLYYSGLKGKVVTVGVDGKKEVLEADRLSNVQQELRVPAGGFIWKIYREP